MISLHTPRWLIGCAGYVLEPDEFENRRGTAKCTMSWKIEVIGKCKKKKNKKTSCKWKRNNYGPIVSCPCLPCCKKQKKVNNESEEKKAEEKCLFRCPVPRMGSSTQPGARWRNALLSWRQPNSKQAGVQKPCPLLPTGGKGGAFCICPPPPPPPLVLSKTSIITKKPVVAKRHISIYVHVCVVGGGVFLHASVWGAVIFSEY